MFVASQTGEDRGVRGEGGFKSVSLRMGGGGAVFVLGHIMEEAEDEEEGGGLGTTQRLLGKKQPTNS